MNKVYYFCITATASILTLSIPAYADDLYSRVVLEGGRLESDGLIHGPSGTVGVVRSGAASRYCSLQFSTTAALASDFVVAASGDVHADRARFLEPINCTLAERIMSAARATPPVPCTFEMEARSYEAAPAPGDEDFLSRSDESRLETLASIFTGSPLPVVRFNRAQFTRITCGSETMVSHSRLRETAAPQAVAERSSSTRSSAPDIEAVIGVISGTGPGGAEAGAL